MGAKEQEHVISPDTEKPVISAWVVYGHDIVQKTFADVLRFTPNVQVLVTSFPTKEAALMALSQEDAIVPDVLFSDHSGAISLLDGARHVAGEKGVPSPAEVIITPYDVPTVQKALLENDPERVDTKVVSVLDPLSWQSQIESVVQAKNSATTKHSSAA